MPSDLLTRRLASSLAPATLNRAAGTVEAVLSTGAGVRRQGYVEHLSIEAEAVELADSVPILDAHRQGSIADVLGRVVDVRFEAGRVVATLRVSNVAALDAIGRGDISGVSIGYNVLTWAESRNAAGERIKTATKWRLVEASLVPLPADPGATIRSEPMPTETTATTAELPAPMTRAAVNTAIRQLGTRNGLPASWSDALIDADADVATARSSALDALMERGSTPAIRTQQTGNYSTTSADLDGRAEAVAHRMAPGTVPLTDASRPYVHTRMVDHARDLLQLQGQPVAGMSPDQLLTRAMHTVADFPALLTGAGSRTLVAPYQAALSPIRQLFRDTTAPDFRARSRLYLSELPALLRVNEAGEIKYGTRAESEETYRLETYARLFSISRQALINDDLGAFADWNRDAAAAAAETENALRASFFTVNGGSGPVIISDGKPLFHPDHGNVGVGAALSVASLSAGRQALRQQKSLDGATPVGATPAYLVVGPALETLAEQILSTLAAATPDGVNPFSGKLTLLVEPRLLASKQWYLFASPAARPVFEQSHLAAAPGPQMSSREGWERLAVEFRVYLDFGCGVLDWRGAYRNPGA